MKRKSNLYDNIYKIENIMKAFDEVCRNTKNKQKVFEYKEYKCIYVSRIYKILKRKEYKPGKYNYFTIYDPKKRRIASQKLQDKIINNLVTRQILYPAILPCLIDTNVASRKDMGTRKGLELRREYERKCKIKYGKYYILKCDISKFFASIDQSILKEKLKRKIKDKDALKIVFDIIENDESGLSIGSMTSQILAIFYLNDLDHFIKEELKIKYYERYQDDFLLFHQSKDYLRYCLKEIEFFLKSEKLELNRKTRIYSSRNNFTYLGRKANGKYANYRYIKKRLNKKIYLYKTKKVKLNSLISSIICYKNLDKRITEKAINKFKEIVTK